MRDWRELLRLLAALGVEPPQDLPELALGVDPPDASAKVARGDARENAASSAAVETSCGGDDGGGGSSKSCWPPKLCRAPRDRDRDRAPRHRDREPRRSTVCRTRC